MRCCPWIPFRLGSPMCPESRRGSEVPHDRPLVDFRRARSGCGCASPAPRCCGSGFGLPAGRRSARSACFSSSGCSMSCRICRGCCTPRSCWPRRCFCRRPGRGVPQDRHPRSIAAARRRIEQASGLEHRPLQALADRPSGSLDAPGGGLWQAHLRRMEAAARRLRVGLPSSRVRRARSVGAAAVLAILLLIGAIDAGSRLARAHRPGLGARCGRGTGCGRRQASTSGSRRRNIPGWRRSFCGREIRKPSASRPAASFSLRCMAGARSRASRSTATAAISSRSTSRTFGLRRP